MSLYLILSLLLQAGLIVHVIKTGRNSLWIWAIALLPAAGPLAYVLVEILPGLFRGRAAQRAKAQVSRMVDPDRGLREASAQVAVTGDVESRRRLGEELLERGQYAAAADAFRSGLTGIFTHDPTLLTGLARAQFGQAEFRAARETLDRLAAENPEHRSAECQLLRARSLEADGDLEAAAAEYAALEGTYPGAEARLRFALVLKRLGQTEAARSKLKDLLAQAELAPRHYRKAQAPWLERARRELAGI